MRLSSGRAWHRAWDAQRALQMAMVAGQASRSTAPLRPHKAPQCGVQGAAGDAALDACALPTLTLAGAPECFSAPSRIPAVAVASAPAQGRTLSAQA